MSVVITSGEPGGVGPDIVLKAAMKGMDAVVIGDRDMLSERAKVLNLSIDFIDYQKQTLQPRPGQICVWHKSLPSKAVIGEINPAHSENILLQLTSATESCLSGEFQAVVTAPVCKASINQAGIPFSGHTEFFAKRTNTSDVVMMLVSDVMRVALVTTHVPLNDVSAHITKDKLTVVLNILLSSLTSQFGIARPKVFVAGLNPHAGEGGYLGHEEITTIMPVLNAYTHCDVIGPMSADTMFSAQNCKEADAFLCMYHDQGLSVLKYSSFGQAVNITLGLPFVRTSVDHGTALSLAGTGRANELSLLKAIVQAEQLGVDECALA